MCVRVCVCIFIIKYISNIKMNINSFEINNIYNYYQLGYRNLQRLYSFKY